MGDVAASAPCPPPQGMGVDRRPLLLPPPPPRGGPQPLGGGGVYALPRG